MSPRNSTCAAQDQDAFSLRTQQRWAKAHSEGFFSQEVVPVSLPQKKGEPKRFDTDEHPRPDTTLEALAKLKPIVKPNGTVTAGNASGINDGACALLLASADGGREITGLRPRARVIGNRRGWSRAAHHGFGARAGNAKGAGENRPRRFHGWM